MDSFPPNFNFEPINTRIHNEKREKEKREQQNIIAKEARRLRDINHNNYLEFSGRVEKLISQQYDELLRNWREKIYNDLKRSDSVFYEFSVGSYEKREIRNCTDQSRATFDMNQKAILQLETELNEYDYRLIVGAMCWSTEGSSWSVRIVQLSSGNPENPHSQQRYPKKEGRKYNPKTKTYQPKHPWT